MGKLEGMGKWELPEVIVPSGSLARGRLALNAVSSLPFRPHSYLHAIVLATATPVSDMGRHRSLGEPHYNKVESDGITTCILYPYMVLFALRSTCNIFVLIIKISPMYYLI